MPGEKILLADDDTEVLNILVKRLRQNNYEVMGFASGRDLIANAKLFNPDLVMLDIVMPDIDGYSVACALREEKDLPDTPIIFMTAQELEYEAAQKKIAEIGRCSFITKSRTFEELLAKIRETLAGPEDK